MRIRIWCREHGTLVEGAPGLYSDVARTGEVSFQLDLKGCYCASSNDDSCINHWRLEGEPIYYEDTLEQWVPYGPPDDDELHEIIGEAQAFAIQLTGEDHAPLGYIAKALLAARDTLNDKVHVDLHFSFGVVAGILWMTASETVFTAK